MDLEKGVQWKLITNSKNIHCLGTLLKNSIPGLFLPSKNEMKKKLSVFQ